MDRLRGLSIWGECRLDFETMHHEQRNHMTKLMSAPGTKCEYQRAAVMDRFRRFYGGDADELGPRRLLRSRRAFESPQARPRGRVDLGVNRTPPFSPKQDCGKAP